ncbi:MAG TPA: cation:proton antiporter [bacterium]|nr:cation:proton antiporter [bacterium]
MFLLFAASGVFLVSKRTAAPYSVLLVLVGIVFAFAAKFVPGLGFIDDFELTPDVLLYVFLPVLLFESAYNMKFREFARDVVPITLLAVVALFISAFAVGGGLYFVLGFIGLDVPFIVALLFGAIISATDPVAVLALFKELGAPRRLMLIFEGESLFNDGTSVALFLVILGLIIEQSVGGGLDIPGGHSLFFHLFESLQASLGIDLSIVRGAFSFISMMVGGILFGAFIAVVFSKIIKRIRNLEFLEISLTLVLAHFTFILAEVISHYLVPVSGVVATTIAAMVVGNYGRYKISPTVEETMGHFWEFFAFISNSLVFMLMGILIVNLEVDWTLFALPSIAVIIVVALARTLSVYSVVLPYNMLVSGAAKIPDAWAYMLSWGSLRGGLAVIMALMIPETLVLPGWNLPYTVREFVIALVVACIVFTIFIKATTIKPMMKRFQIDKLHEIESLEYIEGKMIMLLDVLAKLSSMHSKEYMPEKEYRMLHDRYRSELEETKFQLEDLVKEHGSSIDSLVERVIALHALGIEKYWLKEFYKYNEVSERVFRVLKTKVEKQIHRIELNLPQIKESGDPKDESNRFERLLQNISLLISPDREPIVTRYMIARARMVTARKVLKELVVFEGIDFIASQQAFKTVLERYQSFVDNARSECKRISDENPDLILAFDSYLINKSLLKTEKNIIEDLFSKEIISPKLYIHFTEEIEEAIYENHSSAAGIHRA